ncbi:NAD(P)H-binding protein [Pseudoscardovia suis]|uniref:NAD(P)H-binding protein n=1 Tax=Pseudoscardovia suis TaxID=987063 RepID=UPI003F9623CD
MRILAFGGTGAMGVPLVNILANQGHDVYVTSRSRRDNRPNVTYLQGDAQSDFEFVKEILRDKYDAIVDFMVYSSEELKRRISFYLTHTEQYAFFSSSRVYAQSETPLTESSPRLLDVSQDQSYLATDEYALAKAREENILRESGYRNWTIIRPYITYNERRIQLGVYEKENWLYRALAGRTVVFPKDIADRYTSLTYGPDVAATVVKLLGNDNALGEAFHIVNAEKVTWRQVAELYQQVVFDRIHQTIRIDYPDSSTGLQRVWNPWQIKYDRLYDRVFDSGKVESVISDITFRPTRDGLTQCLIRFLDNPKWLDYRMNWKYEAWSDKQEHQFTNVFAIPSKRTKLSYIKNRLAIRR